MTLSFGFADAGRCLVRNCIDLRRLVVAAHKDAWWIRLASLLHSFACVCYLSAKMWAESLQCRLFILFSTHGHMDATTALTCLCIYGVRICGTRTRASDWRARHMRYQMWTSAAWIGNKPDCIRRLPTVGLVDWGKRGVDNTRWASRNWQRQSKSGR